MFWTPASLSSELIKARGLCFVCGFYMGCRSYAIGQRERGNMKNKSKLVKWKDSLIPGESAYLKEKFCCRFYQLSVFSWWRELSLFAIFLLEWNTTNKISWFLNAFSIVTGVTRRFHLWRTVCRELLNKLINSILTFVLMHCGSHFFPQPEFCTMIVDCCAQQRSYEKFFGLLAQVSFF